LFDTIEYHPGKPPRYRDGQLHILNTYKQSAIGPAPGNVAPFLTLIDYLFDGDVTACNTALGFFATLVQKPGAKIRFAILHVNQHEGTGRGTLFKLLARVLGPHNVMNCDTERLTGRFNGYMMNTQLLIVPELLVSDATESRHHLWNRVKPLITDDTLQIESKGVDTFVVPNRVNLLLASNHPDAVTVGASDRRLFVWRSNAAARKPGYYRALHAWIDRDENVAAVRAYLLAYNASNFNPHGNPPKTAARDELIRLSASPIEQFLREALAEGVEPFDCDLVTTNQLYEWLMARGHRPKSPAAVTSMLKRLGAAQVNGGNQVRLGNGEKIRPWAVRAVSSYCEMREAEIAANFRPLKRSRDSASPPQRLRSENLDVPPSAPLLSTDSFR
jgi:hypothetical protein